MKKINFKQITFFLLTFLISARPMTTFALERWKFGEPILHVRGSLICQGKECELEDIFQLGVNLLSVAITFGIFFSAVLFAWAGWLYLKPGSSEGAHTEAKRIFMFSVGGLLISLCAFLIVELLINTLGVDSNFNIGF